MNNQFAWRLLLSSSVLLLDLVVSSHTSHALVVNRTCEDFTGEYRDQAKGIIVYLGNGQVVVYNGRPFPIFGRCEESRSGARLTIDFGSGVVRGKRSNSNADVIWDNGTTWRRTDPYVQFPGDLGKSFK